jgi:hypothetical protein
MTEINFKIGEWVAYEHVGRDIRIVTKINIETGFLTVRFETGCVFLIHHENEFLKKL